MWKGSYFEQMNETMEAAWRRYTKALRALPPACEHEVVAVVIDNLPCVNMHMLRHGLDQLAEHYRKNHP